MKFQKMIDGSRAKHNYMATCDCPDCSTIREKKKMIKVIPINTNGESLASLIPSNMEIPAPTFKNPTQIEYEQENANNALGTPGVTFSDMHVYTPDNITTVPASIYTAIGSSNGQILEDVKEYGNIENSEFYGATIANMVASNICCIVDRYVVTILNIYEVYLSNVRESGICNIEPNYEIFDKEILAGNIINYTNSNDMKRAGQDLIAYIMSSLNLYASNLYNASKVQLDRYIVVNKCSQEEIANRYNAMNTYFARMMQDMMFESSTFVQTIQEGKYLLIGEEEFKNIILEADQRNNG